jgi:plasmid stability protein
MLTGRNLNDDLKRLSRIRAISHGNSVDEEAPRTFRTVSDGEEAQSGLGTRVHRRVLALTGGTELAPRPVPFLVPRLISRKASRDWGSIRTRFREPPVLVVICIPATTSRAEQWSARRTLQFRTGALVRYADQRQSAGTRVKTSTPGQARLPRGIKAAGSARSIQRLEQEQDAPASEE